MIFWSSLAQTCPILRIHCIAKITVLHLWGQTLEVRLSQENKQDCVSMKLSLSAILIASGKMLPPEVTFVNSTEVRVSWNTFNFHKGGPHIDYEIKLVYHQADNVHIFKASLNHSLLIHLDKITAEKVNKKDIRNFHELLMWNFTGLVSQLFQFIFSNQPV